ncbi:peptidoglycan/LPS O-acetylase OafA/YrhL [Pseudomonas sp. WPR_5_2]|uniref:acyltransferase family protein n=1 Tax=Pseudomonas sp. WPR_5_2 TaxID=1907371 RepID=UPI000EB4BC1D|nr:acyltransferase [Pseudomonas sp. WPR_5_2]RKS17100.1 peptidoglycan/LPS O-acetylase OafA/YrhL [Pseudomonas sp. WPR_5_2]
MSRTVLDQNNNRMWFLQFLRGVACLLIVYVHWQTFVMNPGSLSGIIFQSGFPADYVAPTSVVKFGVIINQTMPFDFREVYLGLALFFLISGFIIPISLERGTRVSYIIRRIARILPTAAVCTVITAGVIVIGRYVEGNAIAPFSIKTIIANAALVRDILGHPYIDTAIWTLEIEVHFYLICFVISFFSGQKKASVILAMTLAFLLVSYALTKDMGKFEYFRLYLSGIALNGCFIVLMFVGMALYNYHVGNWSIAKTALVTFVLMIMNNLILQNYSNVTSGIMYANHLYAALMFMVLMLVGERLPYSKVIDKIAEVSYPLYLLHATCGYTLFYIVYKHFNSIVSAFSLSWVIVIALTLLVHRTVERPSTPAGKRVAQLAENIRFPIGFKSRDM